jgi:hypothetical protein
MRTGRNGSGSPPAYDALQAHCAGVAEHRPDLSRSAAAAARDASHVPYPDEPMGSGERKRFDKRIRAAVRHWGEKPMPPVAIPKVAL